MDNTQAMALCMTLLHADSEADVIGALESAGFWVNEQCWRYFGDDEGNYSVIGVQQSRPDAALAEKVVNAVDARLMGECQARGIRPESPEAPSSIRDAVAQFFEGRKVDGDIGGKIVAWDNKKRREVAREITVAATGQRSKPCFTICDVGEGQLPERVSETLLSLRRTNKLRVPFVQGKFNMGGTGALRFCGEHNLQLFVTRRNPLVVTAMNENDPFHDCWGFTIVRRQNPEGGTRNSVYTYLAPFGCEENPRHGGVLRFRAASLPLMPQRNQPYERDMEWGTAVKLYEYQATGFRSHILRRDGLLHKLELLLPGIALPTRLHECRDYGGAEERSYETNMNSLVVRLEDGRHDNLEPGFPDTLQFQLEGGEKFKARVYAFKKGRAKTYRKNEGIIFAINGQTHGFLPATFFGRQRVKMGRLADSLLVLVDCTEMSRRAIEDLFLNSRDRLTSADLRVSLERELEQVISTNEGLRALREQRRNHEMEAQLADAKPLADVLAAIIKNSPTLSMLFAVGQRLSSPTKSRKTQEGKEPFRGKAHPTYFRFKKLDYGEVLKRTCPVNHRCRIAFTTDAENEYFDRTELPGRFSLTIAHPDGHGDTPVYSLTLHDGTALVSIRFPEETPVGETLTVRATVEDDVLVEPLVNNAEITILEPAATQSGRSGRSKRPSNKNGNAADSQLGIELPPIDRVRKERWPQFEFDQYSACAVRQDESEGHPDRIAYDFHVNVDNAYLLTEIKGSSEDARLLEAQFVYGVVLIGLAIVKDAVEREKRTARKPVDERDEMNNVEPVEQVVARTTRAIGPFVLPMIRSLGSLDSDAVAGLGHIGDES